MPFGLKNAPPFFQKQMDKVLLGLSFASCYIDDIVVWSRNIDEHLDHLEIVFQRLRSYGLKVHPGKCLFCSEKNDFLGYCVSGDGLSPQQEKVNAVRDLRTPTDVFSLRAALGLFGYYRKFVPNFSSIASPLNELLRKNKQWVWGDKQEMAYQTLKDKLCGAEVLLRPNSAKEYRLTTDWSQQGMGAVLSHSMKKGKKGPLLMHLEVAIRRRGIMEVVKGNVWRLCGLQTTSVSTYLLLHSP